MCVCVRGDRCRIVNGPFSRVTVLCGDIKPIQAVFSIKIRGLPRFEKRMIFEVLRREARYPESIVGTKNNGVELDGGETGK